MDEYARWEPPTPTLLVVDSDQEVLGRISEILGSRCRIEVTTSTHGALLIIAEGIAPDLILLDSNLLESDARAACQTLLADAAAAEIPVIFLTSGPGEREIGRAFEAGAADVVTKPLVAPLLKVRVSLHLTVRRQQVILSAQSSSLKTARSGAATAIAAHRDVTFGALTAVAKIRSVDSEAHLRHTQRLVELLTSELADHRHFSAILTDENVRLITKSAPLHDLGKAGISDQILLKPGKLSPEEFEVMKAHTVIGYRSMLDAEALLGKGESNFLQFGCEITLSHHERWDGTGYPAGLAGARIPAAARIVAVADVYDAFICHRLYKDAQPHELAVALIRSGRGTAFDPDVVDAFDRVSDQFHQVEIEGMQ